MRSEDKSRRHRRRRLDEGAKGDGGFCVVSTEARGRGPNVERASKQAKQKAELSCAWAGRLRRGWAVDATSDAVGLSF